MLLIPQIPRVNQATRVSFLNVLFQNKFTKVLKIGIYAIKPPPSN